MKIGIDEYYNGTHLEDIHESAMLNYCKTFYCPNNKCVCGYHYDVDTNGNRTGGNDSVDIEDIDHFHAWRKEFIHKTFVCQKHSVLVRSPNAFSISEITVNSKGQVEITYQSDYTDGEHETVVYGLIDEHGYDHDCGCC